ncbi:MAG: HEAT repeat domain-containing protein [Desulfosporosinus sp.]|nr:HEAT repeat domain-containing protein [Desulfosporosinus sp.]
MAPDIEELKAKRNIKELIKLLNHEDNDICKSSAEALGNIGDLRAVKPLVATLNDENEDVRKYSAEALGKIGDSRAIEPLIEMLKDKEGDVCKTAAAALIKMEWKPKKDGNTEDVTTAVALEKLAGTPTKDSKGDKVTSSPEDHELVGVKGWLIFFSVVIALEQMGYIIGIVLSDNSIPLERFLSSPKTILFSTLLVMGILVPILIVQKLSISIDLAKIYFGLRILFTVFILHNPKGSPPWVIFWIIGIVYFIKSERVNNTLTKSIFKKNEF